LDAANRVQSGQPALGPTAHAAMGHAACDCSSATAAPAPSRYLL
jgi:hypothetical protein